MADIPANPSPDDATSAVALPLCRSEELDERGLAWGWDVRQYGQPVRAFALRFDGQVVAYLNRCVHVPTEMRVEERGGQVYWYPSRDIQPVSFDEPAEPA